MDLITYAERIPEPGETLVGDRFQMGFGGKGANQAVMARLLGASVRMVGCVGEDTYGALMLDNLAAYGIDIGAIARARGSSGVASIWVEAGGTNRILVVPGANHAVRPQDAAKALDEGATPAVVVGQLEIPQPATAAAFRSARRRGAITVLNPAPASPLDPDLLANTDWLIPNAGEFAVLAGAEPTDTTLHPFAQQQAVRLVITLGEDGATLVNDDGSLSRYPAPQVEAIDTTGAGDAFVAGFAYGLAAGWPEPNAVRLGIAIAADSVTRPGAQSSFPATEACREIRDVTQP